MCVCVCEVKVSVAAVHNSQKVFFPTHRESDNSALIYNHLFSFFFLFLLWPAGRDLLYDTIQEQSVIQEQLDRAVCNCDLSRQSWKLCRICL